MTNIFQQGMIGTIGLSENYATNFLKNKHNQRQQILILAMVTSVQFLLVVLIFNRYL